MKLGVKENRVRKIFGLSLVLIGLGVLLLSVPHNEQTKAPSSTLLPPDEQEIQYKSYTFGHSVVHTLLIPARSRFAVRTALSQELDTLANFAQKHQAVAVLNGGFFDPENQKSTSYVVLQGELVADPRRNERLMNNRDLAPYLSKILDRTEFRRYRCGSSIRYDIVLHSEPTPEGCQLMDAIGGGPRLLPELTSIAEGFVDVANKKVIRDPLGSRQPNARSAVGITREGSILLVMVAQKPKSPTTSGMSLTALAEFMRTLGVEKSMNLDGGSSSSFYYKGKTVYGKVDKTGNQIRRKVLSVLLVKEAIRDSGLTQLGS
jgi:hypothetical protein